jgi:ribosomal protein S18 acetylase RimI-like enzyme
MPTGNTPQARIRLMEQNMAGHFSWVQRATGGMAVQERHGWLLVNSGLPCDSFNVLFISGQTKDFALQDALSTFRSRGLPFAVWVGPESPAAPLLEGLGLRLAETETGMLLDAADYRPCAPVAGLTVAVRKGDRTRDSRGPVPFSDSLSVSGLVVERVADARRLAHFAAVVAGHPPDAALVRFYERCESAVLRADGPMRLFVGTIAGEPVATAEVFLSDGVGGVYGVFTLPAYRRRGIGTAMTALAVREAFASGRRLAALQASADGRGVYERLGFRGVCEFRVHK